MATIEIPEELYEELQQRARANGRSITDEAIAELANDPLELKRREYLKLLDRIRALPKFETDLDPVDLIREDRDTR